MSDWLPEAIEKAFEFERHGATFYLKLAASTKNRLARQLLNNLAKDEVQHVMDIDNIYNELKDGKPLPKTMNRQSTEKIEDSIKHYFSTLDKDKRREDLDDLETLKLAMETERHGYQMYNDAMNATDNEALKNLFQVLREEEKEHLTALENIYHYLANPADWFSQDESQVWNWMNT